MEFAAGVGYVNLDLLYLGVGHLPKEGEEVYAKAWIFSWAAASLQP